jgi:hypothetical protein
MCSGLSQESENRSETISQLEEQVWSQNQELESLKKENKLFLKEKLEMQERLDEEVIIMQVRRLRKEGLT